MNLDYNKSFKLDVKTIVDTTLVNDLMKTVIKPLTNVNKKNFDKMARVFVANMMKLYLLDGFYDYVSVALSQEAYVNTSRYGMLHFSRKYIREILDVMLDADLIIVEKGFYDESTGKGRVTRVRFTDKLAAIFASNIDQLKKVTKEQYAPCIVRDSNKKLTALKTGTKEFGLMGKRVDRINRENNKHMVTISRDVIVNALNDKVNDILSSNAAQDRHLITSTLVNGKALNLLADKAFDGLNFSHDDLSKAKRKVGNLLYLLNLSDAGVIELTDTHVTRIFNMSSIKEGGRFYGSVIQNMPESLRAEIKLDGEDVIELDYSEMHPDMLYSVVGEEKQGDAYELNLDGSRVPRKLVKKVVNIILNTSSRKECLGAIRKEVGDAGYDAKTILSLLEAKHVSIAKFFYTCYGRKLQNTESIIAEQVMLTFTRIHEPCHCIHDSFIVKAKYASKLQQSMIEEYKTIVGVEPKIKGCEKVVVSDTNDTDNVIERSESTTPQEHREQHLITSTYTTTDSLKPLHTNDSRPVSIARKTTMDLIREAMMRRKSVTEQINTSIVNSSARDLGITKSAVQIILDRQQAARDLEATQKALIASTVIEHEEDDRYYDEEGYAC